MKNDAKNWLESRLVEDDGCRGSIDATIRLAKLWKNLKEEIPPLLEKTTDCVAFDQKGKTIVVSQEKLDGLWDEINTRKSKITAIEAAAQKLIEIDGRRFCQILQERAELQRKASMGPSAESMVQRIYARNSGRYSLDEIRKMPVVEEEARREEAVRGPLRPLVLDAKRKVDAYTEILAAFVKMY
jgi:hypothetical protein